MTTATLRRALDLQVKIESMQSELARLLGKSVSIRGTGSVLVRAADSTRRKPGRPSKAAKGGRRKKRTSPFKGQKRPSSPSGPLAPAVIKVMKKAGGPMNVDAVLQGLKNDRYVWNVSEPKKNLAARLYTLHGVKKVKPGMFALSKK
ncbi:MAG: hypothetical protein WCI38_07750 [Chthoniobacterales bacterium]